MGIRVGRALLLDERPGIEGVMDAGRAVPEAEVEGVRVGDCVTGVVPAGEGVLLLIVLLESPGAEELTPSGLVCSWITTGSS